MCVSVSQSTRQIGICRVVWAVVRGLVRYAPRPPLCKGRCHQFSNWWRRGCNRFPLHVPIVRTDGIIFFPFLPICRQNRKTVLHNPSVTSVRTGDSSLYTREPLDLQYPSAHHGTIPSGAGQKRLHIFCARLGRPPCGQIPIYRTTERYRAGQGKSNYTYFAHGLAARPAGKFQFLSALRKAACLN